MEAMGRPNRFAYFPGIEREDGPLEEGGQLSPAKDTDVSALVGGGVLGELSGHLGEGGPAGEAASDFGDPLAGPLPALLPVRGNSQDRDVPCPVGQDGLELLPVGPEIVVHFPLGHRDARRDLPPDNPLDQELVAKLTPKGLPAQALVSKIALEVDLRETAAPHHLIDGFTKLLIHDFELLPSGLLHLKTILDQPLEDARLDRPGAFALGGENRGPSGAGLAPGESGREGAPAAPGWTGQTG